MNEAALVALGALLPAAAAAVVALLVAVRKVQKEKRSDAIEEWRTIADRCTEQLNLQAHLSQQHQEAMLEIYAAVAAYNAELGEAFVWLRHFRDGWVSALQRLGEDVTRVPTLPQRRASMERSEFLLRTASQNAELVKAAVKSAGEGGQPCSGGAA